MLGIFRQKAYKLKKKTEREVKWWSYAAWTAPFTALSAIFFAEMLGWQETTHKILITTGTLFLTVVTYWWWWAIYKVSYMASMLVETAKELKDISKEMHELNSEMHKKDK